jgi:uroporphyrinogen-III synthase
VRSGTAVVLTRPLDQAQPLARKIEAAGGQAIHFPALEILERAPAAAAEHLAAADIAIFISANAVEYGFRAMGGKLPSSLKLAAIGNATAQALAQHGFPPTIMPAQGADSEALLETTALHNVAGKHIVIFRGIGGRETLRTALCQRGAKVAYIECYSRHRPKVAASRVAELIDRNEIAAIHVLSRETLENFCQIVGPRGQQRFRQTALFVPHPAVREAAWILGFSDVVVTGFGDEGCLTALQQRFAEAQPS